MCKRILKIYFACGHSSPLPIRKYSRCKEAKKLGEICKKPNGVLDARKPNRVCGRCEEKQREKEDANQERDMSDSVSVSDGHDGHSPDVDDDDEDAARQKPEENSGDEDDIPLISEDGVKKDRVEKVIGKLKGIFKSKG